MPLNLDEKDDKELLELAGSLGVENARWLSRGQLLAAIGRCEQGRVKGVLRSKWRARYGNAVRAAATVAAVFAAATGGLLWYARSIQGPVDPTGIVGLIEDELQLRIESPSSVQAEIYGTDPHVPPPHAEILAKHVINEMGPYAIALRDMIQGEHDSARALLVSTEMPPSVKAYRALGRLETYARNYGAALDAFERLDRLQSGSSPRTLCDIAATRFRLGDPHGALDDYSNVLARIDSTPSPTDRDRAVAANNLAVMHELLGEYPEAELYFLRARELTASGDGALKRSHDLYFAEQLAGLYHRWGRLSEAKDLYEQVLDGRDGRVQIGRRSGETHFLRSVIHQLDGEYANALAEYERGVNLFVETNGTEHPEYPYRMNSLAMLYSISGDNASAVFQVREALDATKALVGETHPRYAQALGGAAGFFRGMGDHRGATASYREAIAIGERNAQQRTPEHVLAKVGFAGCLQEGGQYGEALRMYGEVIPALRDMLGNNDPSYVSAILGMAMLYRELGRYPEAKALAGEALAIEASGIAVPLADRVGRRMIAANIEQSLGQYEAAFALISQAESIFLEAQGGDHPNGACFDSVRGLILTLLGRFDEAGAALNAAIEKVRPALGETHPSHGALVNNAALLYEAQGDIARAVETAGRAVEIIDAAFGNSGTAHVRVTANLARILARDGQLDRARALFEEVARFDDVFYADGGIENNYHLANSAELYRLLGDTGKSDALHRRAILATERGYSPTHIDLVPILRGHAVLLRQLGRDTEAGRCEARAETIASAHAPALPPRLTGPISPSFLP